MVSEHILSQLPSIDALRGTSKSLATLDAIFCREWELRYFSFNSRWAPGEQLASMRNGSGDHYFALFSSSGVVLKGFVHEAPAKLQLGPDLLSRIPSDLQRFFEESAFALDEISFCLWRQAYDPAWQSSSVHDAQDGIASLLNCLVRGSTGYCDWAEGYYSRKIDTRAVEKIFQHKALTQSLVEELNPGLSLNELASDLDEIGYPEKET